MSQEIAAVEFLKTLPKNIRLFYLLMKSYESESFHYIFSKDEKDLYETEMYNLVNLKKGKSKNLPIYQNQAIINDKAEVSPKERTNTIRKIKRVRNERVNDEFAATFGDWASSFSDESDEE